MGKFDKKKGTGKADKGKQEQPVVPPQPLPQKVARGHKQKGSGNVIVGKAPVITNDGVLLRAHERLPTQILQEWTNREKRPAPRYKARPPGNRQMVFVNDAKNSLHDMNFCPVQTDFESEKVAKDYAALLALGQVQGNMPLENKLPEPYCTVWKQMIAANKEKAKKDVKKAAIAKKEAPAAAAAAATTAAANNLPAAVPRKLAAAPKDFMFDAGDDDNEPEPPLPPGLSTVTLAVRIGELDPETADWLCGSCNTQNFAKLASGQLRSKCFKCGAVKSDACELVQPATPATAESSGSKGSGGGAAAEPAAITKIQREMAKGKREDQQERKDKHDNGGNQKPHAFKGSHTGAAQMAQTRTGGKNRQKRGGAPAAVMDLQAKSTRAVEERAREEYALLKRRRQAYFDAVKRANRPSAVVINPGLKRELELVLGLETSSEEPSGSVGDADVQQHQLLLPGTMQGYIIAVGEGSAEIRSGDDDDDDGALALCFLPEAALSSTLSAEQQNLCLVAVKDELCASGFSEAHVVRAVHGVRSESDRRSRLVDAVVSGKGTKNNNKSKPTAAAASSAATAPAGGTLKTTLKELCIEWLCLNLGESEMPAEFALSAKYSNPSISVGSLRPAGGSSASLSTSLSASSSGAALNSLGLGGGKTPNSSSASLSSQASASDLATAATTTATAGTLSAAQTAVAAKLERYGWSATDCTEAVRLLCFSPSSSGVYEDKEQEQEQKEQSARLLLHAATLLYNSSIACMSKDTSAACSKISLEAPTKQQEQEEGEAVSVAEEAEVLESIYGADGDEGDFEFSSIGKQHRLSVVLPVDLVHALGLGNSNSKNGGGGGGGGGNGSSKVYLDVFVHADMGYPTRSAPLALLRCGRLLTRGVLLPTQQLLWRKACALSEGGDSVVYSLASWIQEELGAEAREGLMQMAPSLGRAALAAEARTLFPLLFPSSSPSLSSLPVDEPVPEVEPKQEAAPDFRSESRHNGGSNRKKGGPFWKRQTGRQLEVPPQRPGRRRELERSLQQRQKLPAWGSRDEFLKGIQTSRGMVVTGETGCGKTTQIPQFIHELEPTSKVVICQPRRLAAVGVATRVAEELCCALGDEVGYMVRGDSKCTGRTRLAFCTYGVMLRRLLDDPCLEGIDYIILDEVHERNVDSDFGLALLVAAMAQPKCRFKLILMSATISTDKFASYLGDAIAGKFSFSEGQQQKKKRGPVTVAAPVLSIPGYTFDVDMYYKGDFEECLRGGSTTKSELLARLLASEQADNDENSHSDGGGGEEIARVRYRAGKDSFRIGGEPRKGDLDWDLLVRLTMKLASGETQAAASKGDGAVSKMFSKATGSILIFLPGVPEINRFLMLLREAWDKNADARGSRVSLLPMALHGGLSAIDQKKVFIPARAGELKIVAATNVAEASITIPDVSVVIDSCKVKEMYFVPEKQMNALITKFACQDSLRQRRGRAGRVAKGRCFRLTTIGTYNGLPPNGLPEILRTSIDGLVLQVKAMQEVRAARGEEKETAMQVLGRCPDPPTHSAVLTSESILSKMQAIDSEGDGMITSLGKHLAALPCDPRTGRLLVYGALLGCCYPSAVVAAMLSCQSPFRGGNDPETRDKSNAIKADYMAQSGCKSDQMAVVAAMKGWGACKGQSERRRYAEDNFLSHNRLGDIDKLTREFLSDLSNLGLVTNPAAACRPDSGGVDNQNSDKPKIVAAALTAGLYPQVSRILRPPKRFEEVMGSNFEKDVDGKEIRFYVPEAVVEVPDSDEDNEEEEEVDEEAKGPSVRRRTRMRVHSSDEEDDEEKEGGGGADGDAEKKQQEDRLPRSEIDMDGQFRVFIHPSSVNFTNTTFGNSRYLLYGEIAVSMNPGQGFKAYLRDTTEAASYPLLFFGGNLQAQYLQGTITIDGWIKFVASGKQVALIQATRRAFDKILNEKIENPAIDHHSNPVVKTVCALLNSNSNA
jgi:HrpA-like RNA helicase